MTNPESHTDTHEPAGGLVEVTLHEQQPNRRPLIAIEPESSGDGDCTYLLDAYMLPLADVAVALEVCLAAVNDELERRAEATS